MVYSSWLNFAAFSRGGGRERPRPHAFWEVLHAISRKCPFGSLPCGVSCGGASLRLAPSAPRGQPHAAAAGASLALFAQMWLPALFSFLLGFTLLSQVLGLALFVLPCALPPVFRRRPRPFARTRGAQSCTPSASSRRCCSAPCCSTRTSCGPWTAPCTRASPATGT